MNPWLKLASGVASSVYHHHRAKKRLAKSIEGDEQVLLRVRGVMNNGFFDKPIGYLCISTRALRFEKATSMTGKAAFGSVEIPLGEIDDVTSERVGFLGSRIVLETTSGRREFNLDGRTSAEDAKNLIRQACD